MKTAEEAADELLGTCKSLTEVCTEGEENDAAFCAELDGIAATCDECGWWVDAHELDDDSRCDGCSADDDEDQGDD